MLLNSIDEVLSGFDPGLSAAFYYPTIPHKERDENSIKILKNFSKSVILCEKPSHNTAAEAKEFK
jgi:hypothetical protein